MTNIATLSLVVGVLIRDSGERAGRADRSVEYPVMPEYQSRSIFFRSSSEM
jgi:hypothetical protein